MLAVLRVEQRMTVHSATCAHNLSEVPSWWPTQLLAGNQHYNIDVQHVKLMQKSESALEVFSARLEGSILLLNYSGTY